MVLIGFAKNFSNSARTLVRARARARVRATVRARVRARGRGRASPPSRALGMRVEPPTSTISSTSLFSRPASASTWVGWGLGMGLGGGRGMGREHLLDRHEGLPEEVRA